MLHTKMICTIGPACDRVTILKQMIRSGMTVARLNFSHGSYDQHRALIAAIRSAAKQTGRPVAILQDIQGPRIRTGRVGEQGVQLNTGTTVTLVSQTVYEASSTTRTTYLPWQVPRNVRLKKGQRIFIQDGTIALRVEAVRRTGVSCHVVQGGLVGSHKGVNIPGVALARSAITAKDKRDIAFGLTEGVDAIAASFVGSAADIQTIKRLCPATNPPLVIAKIERQAALDHLDEIIDAADGIMIARGDLGIEIDPGQVPVIQKQIIADCRQAGKPVVVATQMLESMINNPRPTRAEASDVANAVLDGADAVMLSGETAGGHFPVPAVRMMRQIILDTQRAQMHHQIPGQSTSTVMSSNVAAAFSVLATDPSVASAIIITGTIDEIPRLLTDRLLVPVFAIVPSHQLQRQCNLVWGVQAIVMPRLPQQSQTLLQRLHTILPSFSARRSVAIVADMRRTTSHPQPTFTRIDGRSGAELDS